MKVKYLVMILFFVVVLVSCSPPMTTIESLEAVRESQMNEEPPEPTTTTVAITVVSKPLLQLLDYNNEREYDYITTQGQVKNISGEPLKNVTAVVSYFDKDDNFIKYDEALIQYNPIMPDQTSPFEVIGTDNPLIERYKISFQFLFGSEIEYIK